MKKKTKQIPRLVRAALMTVSVITTSLLVLTQFGGWLFKQLYTFFRRPWYNTIETLFNIYYYCSLAWVWFSETLRASLLWLQCEFPHYLKRIFYAFLGIEYLHPRAVWNTWDYIALRLTKILPLLIKNGVSYPSHYKNSEAYHKDLKELLLLCQQQVNDNDDICMDQFAVLHVGKDIKVLSKKQYYKELERRHKRRVYLWWNLLPNLWD